MSKELLSFSLKNYSLPNVTLPTLSSEEIFRLLFICQSIVCIFLFKGMLTFREQASLQDIELIQYSDFKYVFIGLVVIHVSKTIIRALCHQYVSTNLNQRYIGQYRKQRVEKIIKWIYDAIYYSISSVCQITYHQFIVCYLFREESWYPTLLGGTNYTGMMQDYPNLVKNSWLMPYYMFQTSSHLYALLHLAYKGVKFEVKYWEYMLHHSLAVYLLFFSATYNLVVLAIHDLADILLSSGRAYNELKQSKLLIYMQYVMLKFTWIYTRLYVFPQIIWHAIQDYLYKDYWPSAKWAILYLTIQMSTLLVMHIFWTYFMVKVGFSVMKKTKNWQEQYDNRHIKVDENVQGE